MMTPRFLCLLAVAVAIAAVGRAEDGLALNEATVIAAPGAARPGSKAIVVLVEEIEARTTLRLPVESTWQEGGRPAIVVAVADQLGSLHLPAELAREVPPPPAAPEAFAVRTSRVGQRPVIFIVGRDARGVMYGVGQLLRKLQLRPGHIDLIGPLDVATAPRLRWRGHQLGYRPKTNSYDGWDAGMWERYIRDLVILGINAIELIPPHSDDEAMSPHFPMPPLRMMRIVSQLAADYGLECWVWFPAIDHDYGDPATVERSLAEWGEVFRALPQLDAVFVPGGDPGHTPSKLLMALLGRQAENLRRVHPGAGMWVSPQGFSAAELHDWLELVAQKPPWLTGVVYGPWTRLSLSELRAKVPREYPLRLYPDITHTMLCQYPVPDWDTALASTLGREPIAPRPQAMADIIRGEIGLADGFITYSEGCNDDVNKAVWSALAWNPDADLHEVLRDFSRYYLSPDITDDFATGLEALEDNWRGPLAGNERVDRTLRLFQTLETAATPRLLHNWRFQQALYRAYFDAYVRRRLVRERAEEAQALAELAAARPGSTLAAISAAERILFDRPRDPVLEAWRTRIFQLAEALFQSVHMQLSVPLYRAIAVPRGANLDTVDLPLNNRMWLRERFARIRALQSEVERAAAVHGLCHWQVPGPGGFYDDLGNPEAEPHLVGNSDPRIDPEFRVHPLTTHTIRTGQAFENWRVSWWNHASAFYGSAVEMRYEGLDPAAHYRLRVVYVPSQIPSEIELVANEHYRVHPPLNPGKADPKIMPQPREFDVPPEATRSGHLTLRWTVNPNAGELVGFGQVGEVWLLRESGAAGR